MSYPLFECYNIDELREIAQQMFDDAITMNTVEKTKKALDNLSTWFVTELAKNLKNTNEEVK